MNFRWAKKSNTNDKENRLNKHKTNSNAAKASSIRKTIRHFDDQWTEARFSSFLTSFVWAYLWQNIFPCTARRSDHSTDDRPSTKNEQTKSEQEKWNEKCSANEFLGSWKLAFATRICAAASCVSCSKTLETKQQKLRWGQPNGKKKKNWMNEQTIPRS